MKPIEFPEQNIVLGKDQPQYQPLPAYRGDDQVITCWQLSLRDRIKLLFIGKLYLRLIAPSSRSSLKLTNLSYDQRRTPGTPT